MESTAAMIDLWPLDRHERVAVLASGGKDSTAVVYLLREHLDRITCYHANTGDLLPEIMAVADHIEAMVPRFVRLDTNVAGWIAANGLPTDLLPHSQHVVGQLMGEHTTRLVSRYDCCFANLMLPLYERIKADGITLMIRGTKAVDMHRLPMRDGETDPGSGLELWLPLLNWSHAQVMDYLREVGAPIASIYSHATNAPECMRCSAWWGERRATYLKQHHPEAFADYAARMRLVWAELAEPVRTLAQEWEAIGA